MPEVVVYKNYYPFGMLVPNRHGGSDYRYGYNGKDNEVKGESLRQKARDNKSTSGSWLTRTINKIQKKKK